MATVRALETVFYDGNRRRPGDVFEFNGKIEGNKCIELVEDPNAEPAKEIELTVEQLRTKLNGYGIKFGPNAGIARLKELVAEAEGKE